MYDNDWVDEHDTFGPCKCDKCSKQKECRDAQRCVLRDPEDLDPDEYDELNHR